MNTQDLSTKLTTARQQLKKAQARVADLEAQVLTDRPNFSGSEEQYQRIFDSMVEGCQMVGFDWRYLYINDAAARHGQRAKEELLGYTMMERYPGIEKTPMFALLQQCMQERTVESLENEFFYPDGTSAWFELRVQPVQEGIFILSLDITERKRAEEQIRQLNRTLGVLSDINQAIVRIRHLPTLFEKACAIAVEKGAFRMAWVGLLDVESGRVKAVAQAGVAGDYLDKVEIVLRDAPHAQHPLATALGTGRRWVCNDLATDAQMLPWHDEALRLGYRAAAAWPLTIGGEVQGIFKLYADEPAFFNEEELRLIDELAGDISFAMEIAQQEEQRRQAEAAVRRYAQRMEILHQIDLGLIQGGSIPAMVQATVKHLRQLLPCQRTDVIILDETTGEALIFAVGLDGDTKLGPGVRVPIPPDVFAGYDARHVRVFEDIRLFQATQPRARQLVNEGLLCALSALLMDQGRPMGVLGLFADTPGFFTAEHQAIAAEVASQLAIAIKQLRLSEALAHHAQRAEAMRQFLQTTLDAFPAHTTVLDPDGTILNVNLSWQQFADENDAHAPTHYLGTNYLTVCDTAVGPRAEEAAAAAAGIRAVIAGQQDDFYLDYSCHSPTQARWFTLRVTAFPEPTPRRVVVAHINITERKAAEEAEREQRLLAEALRDSLAVLTTSLSVETVMQQILAYSAMVIPSEAGTIILFEGNQARVAYARGHTAEAEAFFKATLIRLESGKFAQGGNHKAAYLAADTQSTPGWVSFPVTEWVRSSIGVPIVLRGETIGLLIADSGIPHRFQPKDVERLQTFAQYAALALENAQHVDQLEQRVRERTTELQTAKERVEAILNNSGDGILLVHPDFTIQQTNAAFDSLFACETDAYFNRPLTALFQAQKDDLMTKVIQAGVAEGQVVNLEVRARRQDDTAFDAELTIGFIKKGGFVCSIRDITQRKAQERQLRYHASLQENVSDAVIVTDTEFRIQSWNRAAERIYGWRAEEIIGRTIEDTLKTRFAPDEARQRFRQEFFEQGHWTGEAVQHRQDGTTFPLLGSITLLKDDKNVSFGIVSVIRDITEQKAQERQLRYHASLQENVSDAVIVTDTEFRIQSWNRAAERIYGWRAEEVIGQVTAAILRTEFSSPADREHSLQQLRERGWWQGEVIQHHKDGTIRHMLGSVTLVKDESGAPFGIVSVNHDITERKQQEERLQRSEKQLQESQQMLQMVLDTIPVRVFWKDRASIILGCNRLFAQDAGFDDTHGLIGKGHSDLTAMATEVEQYRADDIAVIESGVPKLDYEETLTLPGHEKLRIQTSKLPLRNAAGEIIGLLGVYADITARKQAEEVLQKSAAEIHDLYNHAPCGYHSLDEDGVIVQINDTELRWLGYNRDEVINKLTFMDISTPRSREISQKSFPVFKERGWVNDLEFDLIRKDGSLHLPISTLMTWPL